MPMMLSQPSDGDVDDISANFRGVSLSRTSWTIHELNLFINDSHLGKVKFFIGQNATSQKDVGIANSTFGYLNITGGYNIHVSDCTVDGNTVTSNSTLLDVMGGTLSVSNSSFQYLNEVEGQGLLKAVGCRIHMVGVKCSNNKAPGGLIHIQNRSQLFMQNSTFENNGHVSSPSSVISIKFDSSLFISDSLFTDNAALNGTCIWLHRNVSVTINHSTFVKNTAMNGGVIYRYYDSYPYGQSHIYTENSAVHIRSEFYGDERQQSLSIYDSYFVDNKARWSGGVVYLFGAFIDLFVKKCSFTGNEANDGGAIYMKGSTSRSTLVLQQCLFANNSLTVTNSSPGRTSLSLFETHSQLTGCEFLGNSSCPTNGCNTVYFYYGTSSINNCTFSEQVRTSIKASLTILIITNSRWYGHKGICL